MQYEDWDRSGLKKEVLGIRGHDVEPIYQCVLYSGPAKQHGYHGLRNRDRAERLAMREGTITIQKTARGNNLANRESTLKRRASKIMGEYGAEQALTYEWIVTSRNLATQAHGDVKAFVAGARKKDVFRKAEFPQLIQNLRVQTINGIPRNKLHKIALSGRDGIDKAFHMVAIAGAQQDMQQALRTGDRALIRDTLAQVQICVNQRRIDGKKTLDDSKEAKAKRNIKLNHRANFIATKVQTTIRQEALQEANNYIGIRLQQGTMTQEQAKRMMRRIEQLARDPRKAYRMRELARLKRSRHNAIQCEPDIRGINHYLNAKEQYEKDLRAVRQANGQYFVESSHVDRELGRHHLRRSLVGYARLKRSHQQGKIKNYAQAEQELDLDLQAQLAHDREITIRPKMHRPNSRAAAHKLH